MPTAIVRYYYSKGFLIAADGLVLKSDDNTPLDYNQQKIFLLNRSGLTATLSATGAESLGSPGKDATPQFEFFKAVQQVALVVSTKGSRNLSEYARKLGKAVTRRLREAHEAYGLDLPTESRTGEIGRTIVEVFIDGYINAIPSRTSMRFYHQDGVIAEPEVNGGLIEDMIYYSGPTIISNCFEKDARFARFRQEIQVSLPEGLKAAAERAVWYIRACDSDIGRELDAVGCSTVGGHIHMATITRENGFQWVGGFEWPRRS
jgi:hypothetical protein